MCLGLILFSSAHAVTGSRLEDGFAAVLLNGRCKFSGYIGNMAAAGDVNPSNITPILHL